MQLNAGAQMMTLRDCMEYAVSNSTQVRIQQSKNDDARLDRRDAILAAFTPSADGNSYGYYRWGRSIDPETNTYVTTTSLNQGFSVSAGITLFNGFSAINNLKIARTSMSMGLSQERQERDKVCLATMEAYFNVIYYTKLTEILEDKVKFLYIVGENPMVSDPDGSHVAHALEKAFVVVQDLFVTETAALADVVLPSTAFLEKDGTFTNTERRVQLLRQAVPVKGQCKQDWQILCEVMTRLGYPAHYDSVEEIFNEMCVVTPSYHGMTYDKIRDTGCQWPCPTADHPGTPILHVNGPARNNGVGLLVPMEWIPSPETQNPEYPITLMSCRMLYHYHTRTQTKRTRAVYYTAPRNFIELNADDCAEKKLTDGDWVQVTSPRGSVFCEVHVTDKLEPGVAWMPFHFGDGANILSDAKNLDPIAKIPGFKQIGIKVEKVSPEVSQYLTRQAQTDMLEYYKNEGPDTIRHKERAMGDVLNGQM